MSHFEKRGNCDCSFTKRQNLRFTHEDLAVFPKNESAFMTGQHDQGKKLFGCLSCHYGQTLSIDWPLH